MSDHETRTKAIEAIRENAVTRSHAVRRVMMEFANFLDGLKFFHKEDEPQGRMILVNNPLYVNNVLVGYAQTIFEHHPENNSFSASTTFDMHNDEA